MLGTDISTSHSCKILIDYRCSGNIKIKIKMKKLCLTSCFETDNISSVELLLGHNE